MMRGSKTGAVGWRHHRCPAEALHAAPALAKASIHVCSPSLSDVLRIASHANIGQRKRLLLRLRAVDCQLPAYASSVCGGEAAEAAAARGACVGLALGQSHPRLVKHVCCGHDLNLPETPAVEA